MPDRFDPVKLPKSLDATGLIQASINILFLSASLVRFLHIQKNRTTGEFMPERSDPVNQPKSLVATGRIQASINIPGYKDKFYGSKDDQFSLAPPTIDPNLKSLIDKETAWVKETKFSFVSADLWQTFLLDRKHNRRSGSLRIAYFVVYTNHSWH